MSEKPIIYSTPMVRALLREVAPKTQTRCAIKPQYAEHSNGTRTPLEEFMQGVDISPFAPYQPGDILWVRESFCGSGKSNDSYVFCADCPENKPGGMCLQRRKPSIHMPRAAARTFLLTTQVRVQRIQDITNEDAIAEGIYEVRPGQWFWCDPATTEAPNCTLGWTPKQAFMWLWMMLNDERANGDYAWVMNPWVWAYTFERCAKPAGWPLTGQIAMETAI